MANARQTMRSVRSSNPPTSNVKSIVRSMLRSHDDATRELKRGTVYAAGTFSTSGVIIPLSQFIAQGNNVAQREGSEVIVKEFIQRAYFSASGGSDSVRYIIFRDMDAQGASPTVGQVLDTADTLSGFSLLYGQSKRFKILSDMLISLTLVGSNAAVTKVVDLKQNGKVFYYATTDVDGANGAGAYFALLISGAASAGGYALGTELHYFD